MERGSDHTNGNNTGVRAMIIGNDGYDKHLASVTTEESPLLPNGSGGGSAFGEDGDGDAATKWPGATDFEGMPWWKKPLVGLHPHAGTRNPLTMSYRSSGYCLLI
jgi:hypothetical protein